MSRLSIYIFAAVFSAAIVLCTLPGTTDARPALDEVANMAEALRYLEQLDKYYSQIARPRFGRSLDGRSRAGPNILSPERMMDTSDRR